MCETLWPRGATSNQSEGNRKEWADVKAHSLLLCFSLFYVFIAGLDPCKALHLADRVSTSRPIKSNQLALDR